MGSTKRNNKRGSYIMEASLVLPVLIFAVITVVLINMFFYSQMTQRSQMHIALRQEAGRQTETMTSEHVLEWDGEMYTKKGMAGVTVTGKKYLLMEHKGILTKKGAFAVKGSCSGVDAAQYVRYCSLVRGIKNEQ